VRHSANGDEFTAICLAAQQIFRPLSVDGTHTDEEQAHFLYEASLGGR
jgi:hypothetical protein